MTRTVESYYFSTHDGQSLYYQRWLAMSEKRRGAIVLFHHGHEHGGRMAHLVDEFDLPDFDFYAWDARGHGRSPGAHGDSPSIGHSVRDVQSFIEHLGEKWQLAESNVAVIAQGVGAVLVSTWVHDYAPGIRCQVLASPAFKVKLHVPFARPGLRLWRALRGNFFVKSHVKSKHLSHDPERMASFDSDSLIHRAIPVNIFLGLHETGKRIVADAAAIVVPTQLLISGNDGVVHHQPQHTFFARLGTDVKEKLIFPGFHHDTLGERDRAKAVTKVRDFILRCFDVPPERPDLRNAHRHGYTHEEAKSLSVPYPPLSARGLYWSVYRKGLFLSSYLSKGIAIGCRTGFDSGCSFDYIYRNIPAGSGFIGRLADRLYLNRVGWRGLRVRKTHVEELLCEALVRLNDEKRPLRVLDIAAGHGRYVLDALAQCPRPQSILLRDFDDTSVQAGRALIEARHLGDIAAFEQGDAFDSASLAALDPRPTLAIVSGFYELFPDNDAIVTSLLGIHDTLDAGGYLIYTNLPWHPQLEMIARALTNQRNQLWVMRRRTQVEMDQLVCEAGFEKIVKRIDEWGIFSVSLARKTKVKRDNAPCLSA
jgi:alpha-beta hydrolase superfamily lysophospholipase